MEVGGNWKTGLLPRLRGKVSRRRQAVVRDASLGFWRMDPHVSLFVSFSALIISRGSAGKRQMYLSRPTALPRNYQQ